MLKLKFKKVGLFIFFGLSILNFKAFATSQKNDLSYENISKTEETEKKDSNEDELKTNENEEKDKNETKEKDKNETKEKEFKNKEEKNKNKDKDFSNPFENNNKVLEEKKYLNKTIQPRKIFKFSDNEDKTTKKEKIVKLKEKKPFNIEKNFDKTIKNKKEELVKKEELEKKEDKKEELVKKEELEKKEDKKENKELNSTSISSKANLILDPNLTEEKFNYYAEILKKNIHIFDLVLKDIRRIGDSRFLDFLFFKEDILKKEFYVNVFHFIKDENTFSKFKKIAYEEEKPLNVTMKKVDNLYNKYKDKIFLNSSKLGIDLTEKLKCFDLEFKNNVQTAVKFDKDFFIRDNYFKSFDVPGYETKRMVTKFMNRYYEYVDEESKARVVLAVPGWDFKHVVYLKNPSKKVLKEAEELRNVEKYIEEDGIKFLTDDFNEGFIEKIYKCVKDQYYDDRDNLLVLVKDSSKGYKPDENDLVYEKIKYYNILKLLRENLFSRIYNETDYEVKCFVDDGKEKETSETKEPLNSFEHLEEKDQCFFKIDDEVYDYCGEVEYKIPKSFKAQNKDVLNLDSDSLKKLLKKELEEQGYLDFDFDFDVLKDSFKMRFFGNKEKAFEKEKFLENLGLINSSIISKFDYDFSKPNSLTGFLVNSNSLNKTLKTYEDVKTNKRAFEKFFLGNWEIAKLKSSFLKDFPLSFDKGFDRNFATAVVDWSKDYRAKIPMWDLIIKSFKEDKKGDLFSDKVFDIENDMINDYVLRIYENLKNASLDLVDLFFEGEKKVKIYENLGKRYY